MLNRITRTNNLTKNLISLFVLGLASLLVIAVNQAIVERNLNLVGLLIGFLVSLGVAFYWRLGIYVAFLILLIEGFARNYFNNPAILLAKDFVLIVVYLRFFGERLLKRQPLLPRTQFNVALIILFIISLIEFFNPNIQSLAVGLVGIRSEFLYVPLAFLAPELLNSKRALQLFSWFLLIVAIPISIYGVIQFYQGPGAYYSLGPAFKQATFVTSGEFSNIQVYRPNSTFSWPTQYAVFLSFVFLFAVGQIFQPVSKLRVLSIIELPLLVYAILVGGQRTLFVLLPLAVVVMLIVMKRINLGFQLLVPLLLGIVVVLNTTASSVFLDRFSSITQNKNDVIFERLSAGLSNTVRGLTLSPIGVGTGMGTLGSQYTGGTIPYFFEGYYGKTAAEIGWLGLLVYLILLIKIATFIFSKFKELQVVDNKWLVLPFILYILINYYDNFSGNDLDLSITNIFFWFSIGFILAVHNAEQREKLELFVEK